MFYVSLNDGCEEVDDDEIIKKSIQEIHQSAIGLSGKRTISLPAGHDLLDLPAGPQSKHSISQQVMPQSQHSHKGTSDQAGLQSQLRRSPRNSQQTESQPAYHDGCIDEDDRVFLEEDEDIPDGIVQVTLAVVEEAPDSAQIGPRSCTLKSGMTMDDYDTPPESPGNCSRTDSLRSNNEDDKSSATVNAQKEGVAASCETVNGLDVDDDDKGVVDHEPYPVPPPRRKNREKVKNLNLSGCHQNDILFRSSSFSKRKDFQILKGKVNLLVTTAGGLIQCWRERWGVYDHRECKLKLYKDKEETGDFEEVDILSATFNYSVEGNTDGIFTVCTKEGEKCLDVGTPETRQYWLQQLQRARREYTQASGPNNRIISRSSIGLLRERSHLEEPSKETSPFKDILATMERPPELNTPMSADYCAKKSFFQNFARKPSFKLVRSSSDRTPSPTGLDQRSPPPSKPSPTHMQGFQALSKIRKSLRDKRPPLSHLGHRIRRPDDYARELEMLRDDLQASQDDASASKEVITVLQSQLKALQKERETLKALRPELSEGELIEILREKDRQLVDAESGVKESQFQQQALKEKIDKMESDAAAYAQLLEVKDASIVKLTNQLHEMELKEKIQQETPPAANIEAGFYYAEKVHVGTQTDADKEKESLQDAVTAYEMQNKFLNKEVLELNQLRQQAVDREQKLFIEATSWEGKFYQIQSKYLLLLNELHNPQVMVSDSRREMVGHLLKDIVENSEKPSLNSHSVEFDRFGFRLNDEKGNIERLLRRPTEPDITEEILTEEEARKRWDSVIATLSRPGQLFITVDMKHLIRRGIPINTRSKVWKAIVDNRVRSVMEKSQPGYYQVLLSKYNPGLQLSPAAKQIELDLLRTLPNNKHYESPHSPGIPKLRRVLLAFSLHNPEVEYCQGFNRIAAIALLFMNEEDAFWCLVYIVEHQMPPHYYSKQLVGAQVDQAVFKELVCEKLPDLAIHLETHGVDPALFSLNWFLCLFVDSLPVNTYLHIWDAFLFEGSKVLFRYALAVLSYMEDKLMMQNDYMSIFNTFRTEVETLADVKKLTQIAFSDLNPFSIRTVNSKREHHHKILKAQMESLEVIRRDYRKNSVAMIHKNPCHAQSDEEEN